MMFPTILRHEIWLSNRVDSYRFSRGLVLTQIGTFNFKVAYQTGDNSTWLDIPAAEGSTSQVDVTD